MMNKNVVSRLLCAGLSVSMMLSMGSVVFADDDWTIDVEAMKEEAAAKDNKDIKLAYVSMNLANPWNAMVKKGFEAGCEDLGVTYQVIDSEYNFQSCLCINRSKGKSAVTIIYQTQENVKLSYTLDEYDYGHTIGEQAAEWIKDTLDGKAQVCIISQDNVESVIPSKIGRAHV